MYVFLYITQAGGVGYLPPLLYKRHGWRAMVPVVYPSVVLDREASADHAGTVQILGVELALRLRARALYQLVP